MSTPPKPRPNPLPDARPDLEKARIHLARMFIPGSCFEIRIPGARFDHNTGAVVPADARSATVGGYYDQVDAAVVDLVRVERANVYTVINPLPHDFMSRSNSNRLTWIGKDQGTKDDDVEILMRAYLDMDSVRIAGISATQAELDAVLERRQYLFDHEPLIAAATLWGCSGNGSWGIIHFMPLSRDDPGTPGWTHPDSLVEHLLQSLALKYSTKQVKIDPTTRNASRIGCVAGTHKCKGTPTPERPWRIATFENPGQIIVPFDLAAYCAANPLPETAAVRPRRTKTSTAPTATPVRNGDRRVEAYVQAACEREYGKLTCAPGGDRNNILNEVSFALGQFVGSGHLDRGSTSAHLLSLAIHIGLGEGESRSTIDSGLSAGSRDPRTIPDPPAIFPDLSQPNGDGFHAGEPPASPLAAQVAAAAPAALATPSTPTLPVVIWNPREKRANDEAIAHLNRFPGLYQRDGMLAEVVAHEKEDGPKYINMPPGTPVISQVNVHRLREILTEVVAFRGRTGRSPANVPIHVPDKCVLGIHSRPQWPGVKRLTGVVEHPILRPDGSITKSPGYDPETGMIWVGKPIPGIPDNPGLDEAKLAVVSLLNLVGQFEFEDDISRAAWLSCLLTILGRHLIDGTVPLYYFDASTAGSGKSLLCDVISCIVTGRQMTRTAYHHDPTEMDKRILSILLGGIRVTMLDNIEGEFGNSSMDSVLTGRFFSGRILGVSRMAVDLPISTTFIATANNVTFCGDMYRRNIGCRLVSSYERPDQDRTDFRIKDLERHTIDNRHRYLSDALIILRAYLLARPSHDLPTNVYGDWTRIIRGAVLWAMEIDPWAHRDRAVQSDPKRLANAAFLDVLWVVLCRCGINHVSTKDIIDRLDNKPVVGIDRLLYGSIESMFNCKHGQLPSSISIGKRLSSINMTRYGQYRLIVSRDSVTNVSVYSVQKFIDKDWANPDYVHAPLVPLETDENLETYPHPSLKSGLQFPDGRVSH